MFTLFRDKIYQTSFIYIYMGSGAWGKVQTAQKIETNLTRGVMKFPEQVDHIIVRFRKRPIILEVKGAVIQKLRENCS